MMLQKRIFVLCLGLVLAMACQNPTNSEDPSPQSPPRTAELEGFVYVPGGTVNGSAGYAIGDEGGVFPEGRTVTLEPFYMAKYMVTWELWSEVLSWAQNHTYVFSAAQGSQGAGGISSSQTGLPVTALTWGNAILWCNAYSEREGRHPVYYTAEGAVLREFGGVATVVMDKTKSGFRLPLEAEWEFAARGGDPDAEAWMSAYAGSENANDTSWNRDNSLGRTRPVGGKSPNTLGLYDMLGNFDEFCWDFWSDSFGQDTPLDGPGTGTVRVSRGGGYTAKATVTSRSMKAAGAGGSLRLVTASAESTGYNPGSFNSELYFEYGRRLTDKDMEGGPGTYTVPLGRALVLAPVKWGVSATAAYEWKVNGVIQEETGEYFTFTPAAQGEYTVTVLARDGASITNEALTLVECAPPAGTYKRDVSDSSSIKATDIFDLLWGLDEFFGLYPVLKGETERTLRENGSFGTTETEETVLQTAQKYLTLESGDPERPDTGRGNWEGWSLGSPGGYAIFGFDHSVENKGGYDLFIQGNAFGSYEEPAIVWVSQDDNGNGEPDDTWYELAGSARNDPSTVPRYARKYFRPQSPVPPRWEDNTGQTGTAGDKYFPYWIDCEYVVYHVTKTAVPSRVSTGYVDTMARPAFEISDAVQADGSPIDLTYIDFVKVQSLVLASRMGTEFHTPEDMHIINPEYLVEGLPKEDGNYTYQFVVYGGYPITIAMEGKEYTLPVTVTLPESSAYFEIINAGNTYFEKEQGKVSFYMN